MSAPINNDVDDRPWFKEPWPWILMAGPAVAVIGCIITIALAFQNNDSTVNDGGIKRGLVVSKPEAVIQSTALTSEQPKVVSNNE